MKSKQLREEQRLLRNAFPVTDDCEMPMLGVVDLPRIDSMLSYHDTRLEDDSARQYSYLVHFFKDDIRFEHLYERPEDEKGKQRLLKLAQYTAVCTPDFSLFPQMPLPVQQMQVFKSRWCGAFWESMGLCVVPTITWGDERSFGFCFNGVPQNSVVAVSVLGCAGSKMAFLEGYRRMLKKLMPKQIICYGHAFEEMDGNIIEFPYEAFRKGGGK